MKRILRHFLEKMAADLLRRHHPRIIAIVGSVGKTSTKSAVATVLGRHFRVLATEGNYNTELVVPLQVFGVTPPANIRNPFAWAKAFWQMSAILYGKQAYPYEVLVLELGVDAPGDMAVFMNYLRPDITVVTAIAHEHMEQFGTLDMVAREEFAITSQSKLTIFNRDDIDIIYDHLCASPSYTYGFAAAADYQFVIKKFSVDYGFDGEFLGEGLGGLPAQVRIVGEHAIKPVIAAVAVATELGVPHQKIAEAVGEIEPVSGRMNLLRGAEKSVLIDDSYNSSPLAAVAALKTLYDFSAKQRIAVLGSMNELGEHSAAAHQQVGEACDSKKLDLVVTVGEQAEKYLAPAAQKVGCHVVSFASPYDAGTFVRDKLAGGTVVLIKGSQNGVFTEETTKLLLADKNDAAHLVRQSDAWVKRKQAQFNRLDTQANS